MVDLNYILLWIVGFSALSVFFTLGEFPKQITLPWKIAAIVTLCVLGMLTLFLPLWAGILSAVLWLVMVFSLRFGWGYVHPLAMVGQYQKAAERARHFARFFPWAGYAQCAMLYQMMAQRHHPLTDGSFDLGKLRTLYAIEAYLHLLAICSDWVRLRRAVEDMGEEFLIRYIPSTSDLYLRALQEDGRPESIQKGYQVMQARSVRADEERRSLNESQQKTPITTGAMVVLLVMAGVQLALGVPQSIELLGMHPRFLQETGEWWRLFTCAIIHANEVHLGTSLLGLWILGPMVERQLGALRYLSLLVFAAVGASSFVSFLAIQGVLEPRYLLGASGFILGLIGAELGLLLFLSQDQRKRQQLKNIGIVLVIQAIFDLTTPNVSLAAHAGGVISGFIFVVLLLLSRRK